LTIFYSGKWTTQEVSAKDFQDVADLDDLWYKGSLPNSKAISSDLFVLMGVFSAPITNKASRYRFVFKRKNGGVLITPDEKNDSPLLDVPYVTYVSVAASIAPRESDYFDINNILTEHRNGSTVRLLRSTLGRMQEQAPLLWKGLCSMMTKLFGQLEMKIVTGTRESKVFVKFGEDAEKEIFNYSTGFLRVLTILVSILAGFWLDGKQNQKAAHLVLLDEPDSSVWPFLTVRFVELITNLQRELGLGTKFQFLITTHSTEVIATAPPKSLISFVDGPTHIIACEREDIAESMKVLDPLKGLGLVQTQAYGKVVMVENVEDKAILVALVERLHPDKIESVQKKLCFWPLGGRRTPSQVAEIRRQLRIVLTRDAIDVLVIVDRDYKTDAELKAETVEAKAQNILLHVWECNELENSIAHPKAIARLCVKNLMDRKGRKVAVLNAISDIPSGDVVMGDSEAEHGRAECEALALELEVPVDEIYRWREDGCSSDVAELVLEKVVNSLEKSTKDRICDSVMNCKRLAVQRQKEALHTEAYSLKVANPVAAATKFDQANHLQASPFDVMEECNKFCREAWPDRKYEFVDMKAVLQKLQSIFAIGISRKDIVFELQDNEILASTKDVVQKLVDFAN
jgi:hypothetical protein